LVNDGSVDLQFTTNGENTHWAVNAIEIRPGQILTFGSPELSTTLYADGVTETEITVVDANANALVTVDPWLDADNALDYQVETQIMIVSPADADLSVSGHQVKAGTDGTFTYTIQHPTAAGTMRVRYAEVTGAQASCFSQNIEVAPVRRFDFNGPTADTETLGTPPTWTGVANTDEYSIGVGYGWDAQTPSWFERNATGISQPAQPSLYRDGHWSTVTQTFKIEVDPLETYDLRIHTGDRNFAMGGLQITIDGNVLPDTYSTAANEFLAIELTDGFAANGDEMTIVFTDVVGRAKWGINGIEIATHGDLPTPPVDPPTDVVPANPRFDLNGWDNDTASDVRGPYVGVGTTNAFDPALGYGWAANASLYERNAPSALLRDGHWGSDNTFKVNADNGTYTVNVTLGEANDGVSNISLWVQNDLISNEISTTAGQFVHVSAEAIVTDGQVSIRLASNDPNSHFSVNAIEVISAVDPLTFSGTADGSADGTSIDTITIAGVIDGHTYTVSADEGTLLDASGDPLADIDADPNYAGIQIAPTGGSYTIQIQHPYALSGTADPKLRVEEVNGY
jgi:hypothetical protein